jgi:hypothetical protein
MRRFTLSTTFYDTYSMAMAVQNMLADRFEFAGLINEFFCDDACLGLVQPYRKQSALHVFVAWMIDGILYEESIGLDLEPRQRTLEMFAKLPPALNDLRPTRLPLEDAMAHYGIDVGSFEEWLSGVGKHFVDAEEDDLYDWFQNLRMSGWVEELACRMAREVFFVVFQNRTLLLNFNVLVAGYVEDVDVTQLEDEEVAALFATSGRLARVSPPRWVQRAVYHRERGHCALCHKDVSGTLSIGELLHYDHVVPLASGGLNDVTNIQLLCEDCNKKKSAGRPTTSTRYEPWYPDDREDD